ncbi:MAG: TIGR00266 family protein [Methanocellales archaeon]
MDFEVLYRPTYSLLEIRLNLNEAVQAEAGAMVYMSPTIEIQTQMKGGFLSAISRSMLGGESLFINTFKATGGKGELGLAPAYSGDIIHHKLLGENLYVQSGSYIASSPEIEIETRWGGAKSFFSREGLFLLKMKGTGDVFLSSFGAIHVKELKNERFTIDTGHMVAFTEGLDYSVKRVGELKSTLLSGEGLVAEFRGTGKLYIQTRNVESFANWLFPFLPMRER